MKIVLDTNVVISGVLNPDGLPALIVNLLLNGKNTVLYDNRILNEYSRVLLKKKFGFKPGWINAFLDYVRSEGEFVTAEPVREKFDDEDDKKFYEVALTGNAECIVTGNKYHFPRRAIIRSPREFVELYYPGAGAP